MSAIPLVRMYMANKFKIYRSDMERVEKVMELLSLTPYANRKISAFSGGQQQLTTLVTLHHLDITAKYANQVVVINEGRIYQCDTPEKVFTPQMLRDV